MIHLGGLTTEPQGLTCFCLPGVGITGICRHAQPLHKCWGLNPGTSACTVNTSPTKASSYHHSPFNIERGMFVSRQAVLEWTSTIEVLLDSKCFDDLFLLADEKVKQKDCMLGFLE